MVSIMSAITAANNPTAWMPQSVDPQVVWPKEWLLELEKIKKLYLPADVQGTEFVLAAYLGDVERLQKYIEDGIDLLYYIKDYYISDAFPIGDWSTALSAAAEKGQKNAVKVLLKAAKEQKLLGKLLLDAIRKST